jgi:glutathione peroxidase
MSSIYDIEVTTIDGKTQKMDVYRGKTLLIVNVASKCGYTPQYEGLEALHRRFGCEGLVVMGFPCDQFGHQEPGDESEIHHFCTTRFGVTFPLFEKIEVNGSSAHALYRFLKQKRPGFLGAGRIRWNFTKFLVDPKGEVVRRYAPSDTPETIGEDFSRRLAAR